MANYIPLEKRRFVLEKDAIAWAKKEKKSLVGQSVKIETNYLDGVGMWEAVVRVKET